LKNLFGLDIGLWESKDESDSLDDEINAKREKGYPFTNILFEDSQTAVLIQHGEEVMRTPIRNADKLHELISLFIGFKSETITKFEEALENFKADIPKIVETLRKKIDELGKQKPAFQKANHQFLELCKAEINPNVTEADVREMMIQHLLTSDIFSKIFDDPDFHRHNNIGELSLLANTDTKPNSEATKAVVTIGLSNVFASRDSSPMLVSAMRQLASTNTRFDTLEVV